MAQDKSEKVRIEIFGNEYTIKSTQDQKYIENLARYVDKKMREISESSTLVSSNKIAILAALNIADELFHAKEKKGKEEKTKKENIADLIKKIDEKLGQ